MKPSLPGEFSRAVSPFLLLGVHLRTRDPSLPDLKTLKSQIVGQLSELAIHASEVGLTPVDVEDLRYALAAYLDEAVRVKSASQSDAWNQMPLQAELFGDRLAGVHFFDRLEKIRQRDSTAILKVYYLCLALGFEGRYHIIGRAELDQLIEELRRTLWPRVDVQLFMKSHVEIEASQRSFRFPWTGVAAGLAVLSIGIVVTLLVLLGLTERDAVEVLGQMGRV